MELLPLLILFAAYFCERIFGTYLKGKLLLQENPQADMVQTKTNSPFCLLGIAVAVLGIAHHNRYFYSHSFDFLIPFLLFLGAFLFFQNSVICRDFSRKAFQVTLKGSPKEEIIRESDRMRNLVVFPLRVESENPYPHFLLVSTALLLETVVAPIFLFLVGGYALFAFYFASHFLIVFLKLRNRMLLDFHRGLLLLPGAFSLLLFPFTAFAAGKSSGKVFSAGVARIGEALSGYDRLLLLNLRCMVAVLETRLEFRQAGNDLVYDSGDEKLSQRTFVLVQRLLGIQKVFVYLFSYYLYVVL